MSRTAHVAASRPAAFLELTKPRITLFVTLTGLVGFLAGTSGPLGGLDLARLLHTLSGIALVAAGTSAFNQLFEVDLDSRMERTRLRPLPAGILRPGEAFAFALSLSVLGLTQLYVFVNGITTLLAAFTLTSYVFAYTPLKRRSPLSLLVGAVPGALPPLGGYTAAHGSIALPGLVLFALLFLWQMPHFLAIGWRHRDEYGRAGFRILPTQDPTGRRTGREALLYCIALLPVSVAPSLVGSTGPIYAAGAFLLTALFVLASARFARRTNDANALRLFLASLGWLPAVLCLFVLDRI